MIRPPHLDAERIRHALGIRPESIATIEDVLAGLAELEARRAALGLTKPSAFPPDAGPEERHALALAALDEFIQASTPAGPVAWWERAR